MSDVLAAHRALYDAVETADADLMSGLWVDSPDTACVHPGAAPLRGTSDVLRSWLVLMAQTGYIQFFLTDVEVALLPVGSDDPDTAVVTCTENVLAGDPDAVAGLSADVPFGSGTAFSTSVLVRDASGWKFWTRHASPAVIDTAVSDEGLDR